VTPADHVIDLLKVKLSKSIDQTHLLITTGVDDFARYRELVGELRAYSTALKAAKEALKAVTEGPEDE
jgi:hypothetical protein